MHTHDSLDLPPPCLAWGACSALTPRRGAASGAASSRAASRRSAALVAVCPAAGIPTVQQERERDQQLGHKLAPHVDFPQLPFARAVKSSERVSRKQGCCPRYPFLHAGAPAGSCVYAGWQRQERRGRETERAKCTGRVLAHALRTWTRSCRAHIKLRFQPALATIHPASTSPASR